VVAENIFFGLLSAVIGISALRVVTTKNLVHAAIYLVLVLAGVGGIYILLAQEFLAITQVIVYIGAIVVLVLFGLFLTRAPIAQEGKLDNDQRWVAALVALFLAGGLGAILSDAYGQQELHVRTVQRTADVSISIFQTYVIPFEVASVLLLAALVGAVVIARRD
jgi:NADH-quinone oxidoreductase subunit J